MKVRDVWIGLRLVWGLVVLVWFGSFWELIYNPMHLSPNYDPFEMRCGTGLILITPIVIIGEIGTFWLQVAALRYQTIALEVWTICLAAPVVVYMGAAVRFNFIDGNAAGVAFSAFAALLYLWLLVMLLVRPLESE